MTQAHKTYGSIVVLKDEPTDKTYGSIVVLKDEPTDLEYIHPDISKMRFVVKGEVFPGHLWLVSLDIDGIELQAFHDDRFKTYHGPDLKKLKILAKKFCQ